MAVQIVPWLGSCSIIGMMVLGLSFVANVASDLMNDQRWEAGSLIGMVAGLAILTWSALTYFKRP